MNLFKLTVGDEKRMPIQLTQNGAALAWTPESVTLRIGRKGGRYLERDAVMGEDPDDWYYDWTAADYTDFAAGLYDCRMVIVKPGSVEPSGPETAPTEGYLQIRIDPAF